MKKVILTALAVFLAGGLMGCASSAKKNLDAYTEISPEEFSHLRGVTNKGYIVTETSSNLNTFRFSISGDSPHISIDGSRVSALKIRKDPQYAQLEARLAYFRTYVKFYIFVHNSDGFNSGRELVRIDGLYTADEARAVAAAVAARREAAKAAEEARRIRSYPYTLVDWEKVFSTREEAQAWLNDIGAQAESIHTVVLARKHVYNEANTAFRTIQLITTRERLVNAKNSLIEAYNRFAPVNREITRVLSAGAAFEQIENAYYPGLGEEVVRRWIENYNSQVERLLDMYPVN
jgi:hypothetical protein